MRDVELVELYPLISKTLLSTKEVRCIQEEILSCSSAKLRGNCYISLSHLLDCGYRIRKERKAKMIRKASGGGGNELNLEGRIFS